MEGDSRKRVTERASGRMKLGNVEIKMLINGNEAMNMATDGSKS